MSLFAKWMKGADLTIWGRAPKTSVTFSCFNSLYLLPLDFLGAKTYIRCFYVFLSLIKSWRILMRILHIGNTAGVASVIAKFMDRMFDTKSLVVMRKVFDKYGLMIYGEAWDCGAKVFAFKCFLLARKFDIVHVHDFDKIVPLLKFFYSNKPVVLHYHGSRIRNRWEERRKFWSKADVVFVSTSDLLEGALDHAIYVPNPVDTDLFYPKTNCNRKPKSALAFRYHLDEKKAINYAKKYGLQLAFLERNIPYKEMPKILNQYEYYVDRTEISSLSKTALEALACGCKVINWKGEVVYGLPSKYYPRYVVEKVWELYGGLIQKISAKL